MSSIITHFVELPAKLSFPPKDASIVSYSVDCTIISSGIQMNNIGARITDYLATINGLFQEGNKPYRFLPLGLRELELKSPLLSTVGMSQTVKHPKILGVVFDHSLSLSAQASYIMERVKSRNRILKAIVGTTWGKEKM